MSKYAKLTGERGQAGGYCEGPVAYGTEYRYDETLRAYFCWCGHAITAEEIYLLQKACEKGRTLRIECLRCGNELSLTNV